MKLLGKKRRLELETSIEQLKHEFAESEERSKRLKTQLKSVQHQLMGQDCIYSFPSEDKPIPDDHTRITVLFEDCQVCTEKNEDPEVERPEMVDIIYIATQKRILYDNDKYEKCDQSETGAPLDILGFLYKFISNKVIVDMLKDLDFSSYIEDISITEQENDQEVWSNQLHEFTKMKIEGNVNIDIPNTYLTVIDFETMTMKKKK
jgi:hypothetical protein